VREPEPGLARARNRALAEARAPLVAQLQKLGRLRGRVPRRVLGWTEHTWATDETGRRGAEPFAARGDEPPAALHDEPLAALRGEALAFDAVVLYRSALAPGGARHHPLARLPLAGA